MIHHESFSRFSCNNYIFLVYFSSHVDKKSKSKFSAFANYSFLSYIDIFNILLLRNNLRFPAVNSIFTFFNIIY